MKEAYQLDFQHFNERKKKDVIRRNIKRPCLTALEPVDRVLIGDLSEKGGTDKMRDYQEEQIYVIVSSTGNDPVVYKIKAEHNPKSKTRTVHRNMLMHCDNLLEHWNIREPASQMHPVQARSDRKTRSVNRVKQGGYQFHPLTN